MVILGVGGLGYRDAAAALVVDGRVVAAASEDRFTGVKHRGGWPVRALQWCLSDAGLSMDDVDHVALANNPWLPLRDRVLDWYGDGFFNSGRFKVFHIFHDEIHDMLRYLKQVEDLRRAGRPEVHVVRHHLSHMAAAYFTVDVDAAAVLVLDGRGELSTSSQGRGTGGDLEVFHVQQMPHSLGMLSAAVADYLGFQAQDDEFRVMSISSTGEPRYGERFAEIIRLHDDGTYDLDPAWFSFHEGRAALSDRFSGTFGPARSPGAAVEDRHRDLAASLQHALEDAALHMARHLARRTGAKTLLLSGSLAQNWVLNGRLAREAPFDRVVASPYCGDDGTAIGAALEMHRRTGGGRPVATPGPDLGPDIDGEDVDGMLERCRLRAERPGDPVAAAAALLREGAIVGWARGRAEFGPRALGRRSILAPVGHGDAAARLRATVKDREAHHPFGVAMTTGEAATALESGGDRWMLVPARVRDGSRDDFAGAVLDDGTLRVQIVDGKVDAAFHRLLESVSGDGPAAALNTSLNLPGRPPAVGAREVLQCFFTTGMDALLLGDRLLRKNGGKGA